MLSDVAKLYYKFNLLNELEYVEKNRKTFSCEIFILKNILFQLKCSSAVYFSNKIAFRVVIVYDKLNIYVVIGYHEKLNDSGKNAMKTKIFVHAYIVAVITWTFFLFWVLIKIFSDQNIDI